MASLLTAQGARAFDTSGPLDQINVNSLLTCQIIRGIDPGLREFDYNDYDQCGTFVGLEGGEGGLVFGDNNIPAADLDYDTDPINQTFTGDGSPGHPYRLTTVVFVPAVAVDAADAGEGSPAVEGPTLLRLTQTDTYVNGDEHYRTDIDVDNTSGDDVSGTLYHAGDCQVEGFDSGYAVQDDGGNGPVFCAPPQFLEQVAALPPRPADQAILGFVPIDPDASWREAEIGDLFGAINGDEFIPSGCDNCGLDPFGDGVDNGVGLSWPIELDPAESMHVCFITVSSDSGTVPSVPSTCTPETAPGPTQTLAQQPSCKLRISRARVFLFRNFPRLRLVARYRSSDPGDVEISYTAIEGGEKNHLGKVFRHFNRQGIFRLRKQLTQNEADELWTTDRFVVKFKIPGEPGFCARQYRKELTVPRIVEGQRVVFQEDSDFPQPGSGHPE